MAKEIRRLRRGRRKKDHKNLAQGKLRVAMLGQFGEANCNLVLCWGLVSLLMHSL